MVMTRREDPPPSELEILKRRMDHFEDCARRWEEAQGKAWVWDVEAKGDAIDRRLSLLAEELERFGRIIDAWDEPVPAEEKLKSQFAEICELASDIAQLWGFVEVIALKLGVPKWRDEEGEEWEKWLARAFKALDR